MNLGFGIIGCGAISGCHATALRKNPNARLVGVTDAREENGRAFAAQQTQLSGEEVTFFPGGLYLHAQWAAPCPGHSGGPGGQACGGGKAYGSDGGGRRPGHRGL